MDVIEGVGGLIGMWYNNARAGLHCDTYAGL